jgi:YD repeat-containing protein
MAPAAVGRTRRPILANLTYAYDADGRRTAAAGSLATVTLSRTSPAAAAARRNNADNEQSKFNGTSLTFDADGNLTSDGTNTYTWDGRGHLTQIAQGRTVTAAFVYDGLGRRMSKTIGTNAQVAVPI